MKIFSSLLAGSIIFLFAFCTANHSGHAGKEFNLEVLSADTSVHMINGIIYHNTCFFSGKLKELYDNGSIKSLQRIKNGKQEGLSETFYEDGKPESNRWYTKGEKDSVHTGWWQNGNMKYEYHFNNGSYNGLFTEWYQTGKMLQQVMYAQGNEVYGRGWRESGKLYMNFVMKNGRRYGMNNANLCYTLYNESLAK